MQRQKNSSKLPETTESNYRRLNIQREFASNIMAHHHRTSDPQKQQFRRYLEKAGVTQILTNALVALNEEREKPDNALAYVKHYFDAAGETSADTEALQQEVFDLRQKFARLVAENKELKTKLQRYEPASADGAD